MRVGRWVLHGRRTVLVSLLLGAVVLSVAIGLWLRGGEGPGKKVYLIGIDAAEWSVIRDLADEGRLPTFTRFIREGSAGTLDTPSIRPVTAWTSIASGVGAERHGIHRWHKDQASHYMGESSRLVTYDDVKSPRLWDVVCDAGSSAGVYHWLVTWPPRPHCGFMVSGWLDQNDERFHPREIGDFLSRSKGDACSEQDVFALLDRYAPDLFACTIYELHTLQHRYWKCWVPGAFGLEDRHEIRDGREKIAEAYERIDRFLAELIDRWPEAILVVVSAIGFESKDGIEYGVEFNGLLRTMGLLDYAGGGHKMSLAPGSRLFQCDPTNRFDARLHIARFCMTESASQPVVMEMLEEVRLPGAAMPFFTEIRMAEDGRIEVFFDARDPAFQVIDDSVQLAWRDVEVTLQVDERSGRHSSSGIILVMGPGIRAQGEISGASVLDVAPTALTLLEIPERSWPAGLEGRTLGEIFQ